jgi:hypothetical protein
MNLLNKIFGTKKTTTNTSNDITSDLFVDTVAPDQSTPDSANAETKTRNSFRPTVIKDFLSTDFWKNGYEHAIQFPVQERKNTALARIRADYRQSLQQAQQLLKSEKENHIQESLRMEGVSSVLDAQLQRRLKELEGLEDTLDKQLVLSVDDEGWIAPVIAAYNDGFQVGALEYARVNNLLGGLTSLQ